MHARRSLWLYWARSCSPAPGAAETLDVVKSKMRYDFLNRLSSTGSIAVNFSVYFRFDRDPNVITALMKAIDSLTPADIDAYANKHFRPERRIITTLWQGPAEAVGTQRQEEQ